MKIDILQRSEVDQIVFEQWQDLSNESLYINPFYEPWCLMPALRYLDRQEKVFIVTAYESGRLVALFPVIIKRSRFSVRHLAIWKHSHCFLSDPLCLDESSLPHIIDYVAQRMSASIFQIKDHSPFSSAHEIDRPSLIIRSTRGAIFDPGQIHRKLSTLPRKLRMDNGRIKRRLFERHDVSYQTSGNLVDINWLEIFCMLEDSGWKGRQKGSIYSNPEVRRYYSEVYSIAIKTGKIEFQALFDGATTLAASFRLISRNRAFEVKTSYNEEFKEYFPGVVLELMNMEAFGGSRYEWVDSCTSPQNRLVNRLWPDRRDIWNSFYFSRGVSGKLVKTTLGAAFRLRPYFSSRK